MTDSEKLDLLLSGMQNIDHRLDNVEIRLDKMEIRLDKMETRLDNVEIRLDNVELQIQRTENILRNEIRKSEALVLSEVERVHCILDKHIADSQMHNASA